MSNYDCVDIADDNDDNHDHDNDEWPARAWCAASACVVKHRGHVHTWCPDKVPETIIAGH